MSSPTPSLSSKVAKGVAWSAVGRASALGLGIAAQAVIARLLTPGAFGAYTVLMSVALGGALLLQFGLPQSGLRLIARTNAAGSPPAVRGAILGVGRTGLVAAGVAVLIAGTGGAALVQAVFPETSFGGMPIVFGLLVGFMVLDNVAPELFRSEHNYRDASLVSGVIPTVFLLVVTSGALAAGISLTTGGVLAVTIAGFAAGLVYAVLRLAARVRALPRGPRGRWVHTPALNPAIAATTVVNYAITQLDLWVVGALGERSQIALYSAAFRLCLLVTVPLVVVNFVVPTLVVEFLARREDRRLERTLQTVATLVGVPALLVLAVLVLFGAPVCGLIYGEFYRRAGAVVGILALGRMASVITGSCGVTLMMSGRQRLHLGVNIVSLVLTVPAQLVGFHLGGIKGLAIATSAAFALQNLAYLVAVRRGVGIRTQMSVMATLRTMRQELSQVGPGSLHRRIILVGRRLFVGDGPRARRSAPGPGIGEVPTEEGDQLEVRPFEEGP